MMLKRLTGAGLAVLALTGPSLAWTDVYIERAAMAEAGRRVCNVNNGGLAARYKDRATFFTPLLSPEAVDRKVEQRTEAIVARLENASAIQTFCARIRAKDF